MSIRDLLGNVLDVLTGHDEREDQNNVQPASQDPYGDPADEQNVLPSSQDPFGDPADQEQPAAAGGRRWPF